MRDAPGDAVATLAIVSNGIVGPLMSGPGVRSYELTLALRRAFAGTHDVVLVAPEGSASVDGDLEIQEFDPERPGTLRPWLERADAVFSQPLSPGLIGSRPRRWIVDLNNPEPFEGLEYQRGLPRVKRAALDVLRIDRIAFAARAGSAFVCASERQRDMWLGFLAASRRLRSTAYDRDRDLRRLIDVVPYGAPDAPPRPSDAPVLRGGAFPSDAKIIVWGGGIWEWMDPLTAIEALQILRGRDDRWHMAFSAANPPASSRPWQMAVRTRELARSHGLEDEGAVHFASRWTPYLDRGTALLEADIGITTHLATAEARFASRVRVLDYLWAGLPVLCSEGDTWADEVTARGLGIAVPPADPKALADGAEEIARKGRAHFREPLAAAAEEHRWSNLCLPLVGMFDDVLSADRRRPGLLAGALGARHRVAWSIRGPLDAVLRKRTD